MPPTSPAPAPATPPASAALAAVAPAIGSDAIAISGQLAVTPGQTLAARVLTIQAGLVELALAGGVVAAESDLPLEIGQTLRLVVAAAGADGVTLRLAPEEAALTPPASTPAAALASAGVPSSAASALLAALTDQGGELPTEAALTLLAGRAAEAQVSTPAQAAAFVRLVQAGLPTTPASVSGLARLLDGALLGRALTGLIDAAAARVTVAPPPTPATATAAAPAPAPPAPGAAAPATVTPAPQGQNALPVPVLETAASWRAAAMPIGAPPPPQAPSPGEPAPPLTPTGPAAPTATPAPPTPPPTPASAPSAAAATSAPADGPEASVTALVAELTRAVRQVEAGAVDGRADALQRAISHLGVGLERGLARGVAPHEAPVRSLLLALAAHPAADPALARAAGGVADAVGAQPLAGSTLPPPAGADPSSVNGAYLQIPLPGGGTAEVRVSPDAGGDAERGDRPRRLAFLLHLSALGPVMVEATAGARGVRRHRPCGRR